MEEALPVIYGLEFQSRCLAAQSAESEKVRFLVGTQSLRADNQIHLLDFDEDSNTINKAVFRHSIGEVWHISSSPSDPALFATCYNETSETKAQLKAALWRLPPEGDGHTDDVSNAPPLGLVSHVLPDSSDDLKSILWHPAADVSQMAAVGDSSITLLDIKNGSPSTIVQSTDVASSSRGGTNRLTCAAWNPHHDAKQLAVASETNIKLWDTNSNSVVQSLDAAHSQPIRDMDWNPNRQYTLATCGDDGRVRVWDIRQPAQPLKLLADHSHWIWTVQFNRFHDQLLLTSSSDSRVLLTNLISVSSEPFGTLLDQDDDDEDDDDPIEFESGRDLVREDGVLHSYDEHEESVYCAEWSAADPWLFASLSYDGRVIVSRVPRSVKYAILL